MVQTLRLIKIYKQYCDNDFYWEINKLIAIALLPIEYMDDAINIILNNILMIDWESDDIQRIVVEFISYFERTWQNGRYSLAEWNFYKLRIRTNNGLERWNRTVTAKTRHHPTLATWIHVMCEEEALAILKNIEFQSFGKCPVPKRDFVAKQKAIDATNVKFENKEIDIEEFLNEMVGNFFIGKFWFKKSKKKAKK